MQLMRHIRESIKEDKFPQFVKDFMVRMFPDSCYPEWVLTALTSVNIDLLDNQSCAKQHNRTNEYNKEQEIPS